MHVTEARILIGSAVVSAVVSLLVVVHRNREAPTNATIEIRSTMPQPVPVAPEPVAPEPVAPEPVEPPDSCDAISNAPELEQQADANVAAGAYVAALRGYEQLLPCKPSLVRKAYLAACRARQFDKAKSHYQRIGKESLAQICLKEGFDPR